MASASATTSALRQAVSVLTHSPYTSTIPNLSLASKANSRVVVQGFTGKASLFHNTIALNYGTNIVGGVSPGKGGQKMFDRPVYSTLKEAVNELKPDASLVFVPPKLAADAIINAIEEEIGLVVAVAEGIPTHDQLKIMHALKSQNKTRLVGANSPGLICPINTFKLGIQPLAVHTPGRIGVAGRSGTMTYEAASQLSELGLGQSYVFGLGGDPFPGSQLFASAILFNSRHCGYEGIVLIGEVGGQMEEEAADFLNSLSPTDERRAKPIVGYVAGQQVIPFKAHGHAGAWWDGERGGVADKRTLWESAGIRLAENLGKVGVCMKEVNVLTRLRGGF
ncbi:putative succinyl-CoA ligase subunit alpha, mitochondrial-like protein [Atractiella rhizophila]|nr:putative succinyl-CoA ligase subunit alpha, mitochondrial-like protein [Atractiella rhizophila]